MLQNSLFVLLISLFLGPFQVLAQETDTSIHDFIGMEASGKNLTELFGTSSYHSPSRNKYQLAFSFSAQTGFGRKTNTNGERIRIIKEIYIGGDYLEKWLPGKEILPGLKKKSVYEDAIETLKKLPGVTYVKPSMDMNGKFIEFGLETQSSKVVHYHLRYRPLKRSKYFFVAMYIRNVKR